MGRSSARAVTFVVIAIAVATVGCGSSDDSGDGAPTTTEAADTTATESATTTTSRTALPAACDLVTPPEAEALAGTPLDPPQEIKETCTYTGPVTGPTAQVEVFVGDGAKKFYDTDLNTLQHEFTDVSGIGDEAHQEENVIFFKKGSTWVSIRLVLLNDPVANTVPLQTAAKAAAARV